MTEPDFPEELHQVTEHVWVYPRHPDHQRVMPNIGVILSGDATVLVDAGNSPRHGQAIQAALDKIDAPPVQRIIYTHYHWDHVCGAQVFDAPVTSHRSAYEKLREMQQNNWGKDYLLQRGKTYPMMMPIYQMVIDLIEWEGFRLVIPQDVFDALKKTFVVNGLEIAMEHVGGKHAADSVVVAVDGVMFLGDCYYGPAGPDRKPDATPEYDLLARLLETGPDRYVAGHADPFTRQEALDWLADQPGRSAD